MKSTPEEVAQAEKLVQETRVRIHELIEQGKKVHIIWDFDGVLTDSRSDDVFALLKFNLKKYFEHEERLLLDTPGAGSWLLPIAHNCGAYPHFPPDKFTQDIVTARSSTLAMRVQIFCLQWQLPVRWMLFLGHQPKKGSYRIILDSFKGDPDCFIFCIDDSAKHIAAFQEVSKEMNMEERTLGIVAPVIRAYTKEELEEYLTRVMNAEYGGPIGIRDPSDTFHSFMVLPKGLQQFKEQINALVSRTHDQGSDSELRRVFVEKYGEVGVGRFKTEDELEEAMRRFILDLVCP